MLTLLEWAKLNPSPLVQGVVEIFARENPILLNLPFENINGPAYVYNLEGTLPGVAFRGIGESYSESTGVVNPQVEALKICGGDSDYDTFLVSTGTGTNDARAVHDGLKSKALALRWAKTFFDGNSEADPREFDGLNRRLTGGQHIQLATGGATLTLAKVNELIDAIQGTPSLLLMNKTLRRKVTDLAAGTAAVTMTVDQLGRPLTAYAGIPIGIVEDDDEGNAILGFDEDDGSGNLDTASIYAVKFDMGSFHGIQTAPVDVRDLGELPNKPAFRTRVEWFAAMVLKHPKSAARLSRINNA
jgi:hypothetical protein